MKIIELLSGSITELANIHWDDVDFERRLINVRRKPAFNPKTSNSERSIPIAQPLYDDLVKAQQDKKSDTFVFTSFDGSKIKERTLLEVCKRISKNAGITSRAFLHKFRHTYATMLIHNGVMIQNIKELLGHWSVSETERYAHNKSDHFHSDVSHLDNLLPR